MKLVWMIVTIILLAGVINWMRDGADWPLPQVVPLLGGHEPGIYDLAGLIMIAILVARITGRGKGDEE